MAKKATTKAKTAAKAKMPVLTQVILAASIVPLCAIFLPTFVLMVPLLAPTILALIFDRNPGKHLALSVGMLNCCGSFYGIGVFWSQGHAFSDIWPLLADPLSWLFAYSAASVGWLVYSSIAPIIAVYYKAASEARIRNLMIQQQKLVETWGDGVREAAEELNQERGVFKEQGAGDEARQAESPQMAQAASG